jgi:large repetitive protein
MARIARIAALLLAPTLIGAAPASAAVVTCGQVITTSTTVENDLSCPELEPGEAALRIGAPGITLDLNGHRIFGSGRGIVNAGYNRVTIRNGTVVSNRLAMSVTGVKRNTITNLTFSGITDGLYLGNGDYNQVTSNVFQGVTAALGSSHTTVAGNEMQGTEGLLGVRGSHNQIVDNTSNTSGMGFSGGDNYIARNDIRVDVLTASVTDLDDSRLIDNVIVSTNISHTPALVVRNSSRNVFRGNALFRGTFHLGSGSDNLLRKNVVWGAGPTNSDGQALSGDGFLIEATMTGTTLVNNLAVANADDGIDVRAPGTVITRNRANDNGGLGIRAVSGVVDGGGNTATGNGNPFQCLNVVCR